MTLGVMICIFGLVCLCLCFLPPCQKGVLCYSVCPKKVPVQVKAADWVKSWRLLNGGIQLMGHFKVEPAADLASLSLSLSFSHIVGLIQ